MVSFRPVAALTPPPHLASEVAAPPYDVVNRDEARALLAGKPNRVLRVTRVDALLPDDADPHAPAAYARAKEELEGLKARGALVETPARFYIYAQEMQTPEGPHRQVGVMGSASAEDYWADRIKKHEFTLPQKEEDRLRLTEALRAHMGPVFLTYRAQPALDALVARAATGAPWVEFVAEDGVRHALWPVTDAAVEGALVEGFAGLGALYIADGHHRAAAAARVGRGAAAGDPRGRFLAVAFPHDQLCVMPYNRVVRHLNGHTPAGLLAALQGRFAVTPLAAARAPAARHEWAMCLGGAWYSLRPTPALAAELAGRDVKAQLAVSVLQDEVLEPLLGVRDPRTAPHIEFVGGIRGLAALERGAGAGGVAFALAPTSTEEVMAIADRGEVMPPKSTWFEPKLRSGLVVSYF